MNAILALSIVFFQVTPAPSAPPPTLAPTVASSPAPTETPCQVRNRKARANLIGGGPLTGEEGGSRGTGSAAIAVWVDENGDPQHIQVWVSSGNVGIDNRDLKAAEDATYVGGIKNCVPNKQVIIVYPEIE